MWKEEYSREIFNVLLKMMTSEMILIYYSIWRRRNGRDEENEEDDMMMTDIQWNDHSEGRMTRDISEEWDCGNENEETMKYW